MDPKTTLPALERELAAGDGETYRRLLTDDARIVVPGQSMTKDATVEAMNESPGWDAFTIEEETVVPLADDVALLTSRFSGRRGDDFEYTALLGSVYVRTPDGWRMAFHQQTPLA